MPARVAGDPLRGRAQALLRQMLGAGSDFRSGQWEAIHRLVQLRARLLVVQKTGWGKSIVYFIATRMRRDAGAGPTLLISPLLSLMRNQLEMAARVGIRALSVNSTNSSEWDDIEQQLRADTCDLLMVSPERLANERFLGSTVSAIRRGIGLFVVDEAHCISDWGHDFRPDYRRIVEILKRLPENVPVLATTATANNRVIADVQQQLGRRMAIIRGPMRRHSLRLLNLLLPRPEQRLAWLAAQIPAMHGSGIVYCLTIADCERVAAWLRSRGIDAEAYHANLNDAQRGDLEQRLLQNRVKAVVATVALGMGFDKPDLGFVVHYQRPGSVIAYYQQIGRAGRAVSSAHAVLLHGDDEDRIHEYFIESAFPTVDECRAVVSLLEKSEGMRLKELLTAVDIGHLRLEKLLKFLEVEEAIAREKGVIYRTAREWHLEEARIQRITEQRYAELERMRQYVATSTCLWEFLQRELDDPKVTPCGHCANCAQPALPLSASPELIAEATQFLRHDYRVIEPRRLWPERGKGRYQGAIPDWLRIASGRALCAWGDEGWGEQVRVGKYKAGRFCEELVRASAELVRDFWRPTPMPTWVTAVPSLRHPVLVLDLASRLATALGLPFRPALAKVKNTDEQKLMHNSAHQVQNLVGAFAVAPAEMLPGPVLLVDDMVDSRWTMTVCGALLREAGAELVYPFALADSRGGDKTS